MKLYWNYQNGVWFLETATGHVAGNVEQRSGKYYAGHAVQYSLDEDGEERDWQPAERPFDFLHEATAWVEENAVCTVQGEPINFLEISLSVYKRLT